MAQSPDSSSWNSKTACYAIIVILACIAVTCLVFAATCAGNSMPVPCRTDCPSGAPLIPVFTAPAEKIAAFKDPLFTRQIYGEAVTYEPLLGTPGTQVHMGFWSGKGNHGSMLRLLDAINEGPAASAVPPNRAIWDEGVNAYYNYPSYSQMMNEHWYERAAGVNGTVTVFGRTYTDPNTVTFAHADEIWGQYSARYTDMAGPIAQATGVPVKTWCFVQGAKANRVFYTYELPQLRLLEQKGAVEVHFAKTPDADWTKPEDWINGTANAPPPSG